MAVSKVKCIYCNKKIVPNQDYCPKCGRDIRSMWQTDTSEENSIDSTPMYCPNPRCHALYTRGTPFCNLCGNDFKRNPPIPESDFTLESVAEPPKPRPVPEATILYWAEMAKTQFEQIMPDLGIPFPPVYTSTASSYSHTRKKIIKSVGCPHTEEPPDSIMEYIHGEKGNAILIRRELVADLPVHDDFELHVYFERFFWHELGHFYAINAETDNLHRYNEPGLLDDSPLYDAAIDGCGYSSERRKQEGYWFWQEFIAEVIANHVSYTIRSGGDNYHPELLDWTIDVWGGIINQLEDFLEATLYYYSHTIVLLIEFTLEANSASGFFRAIMISLK